MIGKWRIEKHAFLAGAQNRLRHSRLSKRNPESIIVANDELPHAIKRVIRNLHNWNPVLKVVMQLVHILHMQVQINFTALSSARFSAGAKHEFAVSVCQRR